MDGSREKHPPSGKTAQNPDGSRERHPPSGKTAQNPDGSREDNCSSNFQVQVAATINLQRHCVRRISRV